MTLRQQEEHLYEAAVAPAPEPTALPTTQTDALGSSLERSSGRAGDAVAAAQRAKVQARIVQAIQRPRQFANVRQSILAECRRPAFAEASRFAIKNRGEGWTIRFAEAMMRAWGNTTWSSNVTHDDPDQRIVLCEVSDLETNASIDDVAVIAKRVERKFRRKNEEPLDTRTNSYGDPLYVYRATDDEASVEQRKLTSKVLRTLMLRLVPGDLLDECHAEINKTLHAEAQNDPKAVVKRMRDAFVRINIPATELRAYVGKDLDELDAAELTELKGLHTALRDQEISWAEALAEKGIETGDKGGAKGAKLDEVTAKLKKTTKPPEDG